MDILVKARSGAQDEGVLYCSNECAVKGGFNKSKHILREISAKEYDPDIHGSKCGVCDEEYYWWNNPD